MHLRDYLHDIPLKALKDIANSLNVTVEYQARIKLINAVDKAFWDGTLIEKLLNNLSDNHRSLLSVIAFSYDAGIREKKLINKAERTFAINKLKTKKLVDDLLSLSLVGGINGEEVIYFCPRGLSEKLREILIRGIIEQDHKSIEIPSYSPFNLLEDIFSILSLVYKEDISLTLTGRMKKSFLCRAFSGSPTCNNNCMNFSEDSRNTFIIGYLKEKKLIEYDNRKVQTTKRLSGWLELSFTERFQDIATYAFSHILNDNFTIIPFIGLMRESSAGTFINTNKLAYFLHSNTMSQGGFSRLELKVSYILNILTQLGLFSFINESYYMTVTGEKFFNNENLPFDEKVSGSFTTQPNFEIIAGPELDPRVRFKLELLSSRTNRDTALTYALNKEGINRAKERGMSTDEVMDFFEKHSRNPLPQNIKFSIESWAKDYGSIYFENRLLMRFRDSSICDSISHIPEVAPYIKEKLSGTVLVISSKHISMITSIIKNAGFQPEVFGTTINDDALLGDKYFPNNINKLFDENKLPEVNNKFIFPEQIQG